MHNAIMILARRSGRASSLLAFVLCLAPSAAIAQTAPTAPAAPAPSAPPAPAAPSGAKPDDHPWRDSPAADADPPEIRAPLRDRTPVSTSGTEIAPPEEEPSHASTAATPASTSDLESRLAKLEDRLARAEERLRHRDHKHDVFRHLHVSGFIQPQFLVQSYDAAASPNRIGGILPAGISSNDVVALPDGTTTNDDYFRLRRTRLRVTYETPIAAMRLEIDPLPLGGPGPGIGTIVRDAEAVGIARWTKDVRTEFSAGVFLLPIRLEFLERSRVRPFIERSYLVNSLMPNGRDLGVHARTVALRDRLVVDVGVVNGQSLDSPYFVAVPDLNQNKDFFGQATYELDFLKVGASGYLGTGETVDAQALRVKNFSRWMGNFELNAHAKLAPRLGETSVTSELTFTQNMDPGRIYAFARPAIPATISDDVRNLRGRGFYVRVEQELKEWLVGYRYDTYTPNGSIATNLRDTHAFVVTYRFSKNLRWMNELDYAIDNIHPDGAPPPSKHIVMLSSVLQAMF